MRELNYDFFWSKTLVTSKSQPTAGKQKVVSRAASKTTVDTADRLVIETSLLNPELSPRAPASTDLDATPAKQVLEKVVQPPSHSKVRPLKRAAPVAAKSNTPVSRVVLAPVELSAVELVKARAGAPQKKRSKPVRLPKAMTPAVETQLESNLSKQPPKALNSPIRIFQIYFEAWQRELLDPAFYPLDNSRGSSELMEFAVFEQLQKNAATEGAALWGALSWRFGEKTGMLGSDWVKQILDHPGYDVYFCNPHTHNEAIFHNMWLQGETSHPSFVEIVKAFFQAAGLDEKEIMSIHPSSTYSAANYFVATPAFWARFIPYVRKVLVTADKKLPPRVRDVLHSKVADDKGLHGGATYIPFIVERLFGLFMRTEAKDLKGYKIALPERERELNVHLKLLREMKDVAHRTQSAWLAACWVNYRNLYLSQTNTKAWCDKYLRAITPTEVRFV